MCNENVKAAIDDAGIKQTFIAEKVGISTQHLTGILKGRQKMDVDTFFKISEILHMSPEKLYTYQPAEASA